MTIILVAAVATLLGPAAPARAAVNDPIVPGVIYALDQRAPHNIYAVDPATGALTLNNSINTPLPWLNGLAIDPATDSFWAVNQIGTGTAGFVPTIYKVVASTGVQTQFAADPVRGPTDPDGLIVMGALDQATGIYYYGRVLDSVVYIQAFDTRAELPVPGIIARVPVGSGSNGDFAFVGDGNLYLAAQGGLYRADEPLPAVGDTVGDGPLLATTAVAPIGTGQLNSAAFGDDGYLYLGSTVGTSNQIIQVDPGSGEVQSSVTTSPANSLTDFASTSPPYTIELQKDLPGGRTFVSDQFGLSITGGDIFGGNTGTTSGSEMGIQNQEAAEVAGRVLALPGTTYTISEAGTPGTDLGNYSSRWSCLDGDTVIAEGTGTTGDVTMPTNAGAGATVVCTIVNVAAVAGYTVAKTSSTSSASPGDVVSYTVTVTNTGDVSYTAANPASFTDDLSAVLDDAAYNGDATSGANLIGSALSWSGPLGVGESVDVGYSVTIDDPPTGDLILRNAVVPTGPGGTCESDVACETSTPVRGYTVSKVASAAVASLGSVLTYTVTVTNTGEFAYTNAQPASFEDDLTAVLDDATFNDDASGGATLTGSTLSWSGALPVGATVSVTYSVTVNSMATGDLLLTNVVLPTNPDGRCVSADGCETNQPVVGFVVEKGVSSTSARPGDIITFTITMTNVGSIAYTDESPATFTDDLAGVLAGADYNDDASGGATVTGSMLTLTRALAVGEVLSVTYSFTVSDGFSGTLPNVVVPGSGGICNPGVENACRTTTTVPPSAAVLAATGGVMSLFALAGSGVLLALGLGIIRRRRTVATR